MSDEGRVIRCGECSKKNRVLDLDKKNVCGSCGAVLKVESGVVELTEDNFRSFLDSESAVIVDFWAGWCGPCIRMAPIFKETALANPAVAFAKLDTEAARQIAVQYRIESIPSLLYFRNGEEVGRLIGLSDGKRIEAGIESWLTG